MRRRRLALSTSGLAAAILTLTGCSFDQSLQSQATEVGPTISERSSSFAAADRCVAEPPVVSHMECGWLNAGAAELSYSTLDGSTGPALRIQGRSLEEPALASLAVAVDDWESSWFSLRLASADWAQVDDLYVLVEDTSGRTAAAQLLPRLASLTDDEWIDVTFSRSDFTIDDQEVDWSSIAAVHLQIYSRAGRADVWADELIAKRLAPAPLLSIVFDDGYADTATIGFPAMDSRGLEASVFPIPELVGTPGYLTVGQIERLAEGGWDISGHGVRYLPDQSIEDAEQEVEESAQFLTDGGHDGGGVYAYPRGGHNEEIRGIVSRYFDAARGTASTGQHVLCANRYQLATRQVGPGVDSDQVEKWIASAEANGDWLILTFHRLTDSPTTPEDFTPQAFLDVLDYVSASGIEVVTIAEAIGRSESCATPAPHK